MRRRWVALGLVGSVAAAGLVLWPEAEEPRERPSREPAPRASTPSADGGAAQPPAARCDHPFVPAEAGLRRVYAVRGEPGGGGRVSLEVESLGMDDGEVTVRWSFGLRPAGGAEVTSLIETRCEPGGRAEDPWSLTLPAVGPMRADDRWRWPGSLAEGDRFGSVARVRLREGRTMDVERRHQVLRRESVRTPAGTFGAWAVRFREQAGPRSADPGVTTGTLWVARDIGLVRSETRRGEHVQVMELVAVR